MLARVQAFARSFHADQARVVMGNVGVEDTHGVRSTAHAGQHGIGLFGLAACPRQYLGHLHQAFPANHTLKVTHHHRVGVGTRHGANDVKSIVHVGHPVAHGFVQRVFQRLAA